MGRDLPHVEVPEIAEIANLIATFSEEEKVALEADDYDLLSLQKQADLIGFEMANDHYKKVLESLEEDIETHRENKRRAGAGLTMTKLLARYLKLSPVWRIYVRGRMNLNGSDSEDEDEDVDIDKRERDEDGKLFASFAALENDKKDPKFVREVMDIFAKILTEVEEVV